MDLGSDDAAGKALDDALAHDDLPPLPEPGEQAGLRRGADFRDEAVSDYQRERDRPDHDGTSRVSPYLKVGALHPRTLLADLAPLLGANASVETVDVDSSETLARRYGLRIPVLTVGELELSGYPLDRDRVRRYLESA